MALSEELADTIAGARAAQARVRCSPRHTLWLSVYYGPRGILFEQREPELMRSEIASLHPPKLSIERLPPRELSDGVVRLRIPTLADIDRVARYGADPMFLEGIWIPGPRPGQDLHEWASAFVQELLAGWTAVGGIHGGSLIVDEREPFLGIVYLAPSSAGAVELSYGVAPHARGRSIATRATRLAAEWALREGGFEQVELRIEKQNHESQRRHRPDQVALPCRGSSDRPRGDTRDC